MFIFVQVCSCTYREHTGLFGVNATQVYYSLTPVPSAKLCSICKLFRNQTQSAIKKHNRSSKSLIDARMHMPRRAYIFRTRFLMKIKSPDCIRPEFHGPGLRIRTEDPEWAMDNDPWSESHGLPYVCSDRNSLFFFQFWTDRKFLLDMCLGFDSMASGQLKISFFQTWV